MQLSRESLLAQGQAALEQHQYKRALIYFKQVVDLDRDSFAAWLGIMRVFISRNKWNDVIKTCQTMLEFEPDNNTIIREIGKAYMHLHQYGEAIASFDAALALEPNDYLSMIYRGESSMSLAHYEEALDDFNRALTALAAEQREGSDRIVDISITKGDALFRLKRYQEALLAYEAAIALDPRDGNIWRNKGACLAIINPLTSTQIREGVEAYKNAVLLPMPKLPLGKRLLIKFASLVQAILFWLYWQGNKNPQS